MTRPPSSQQSWWRNGWWRIRLTRRQWTRFARLTALLLVIGGGLTLILLSFESSLIYFYMPSQIAQRLRDEPQSVLGRTIRAGGIVQVGSVQHRQDGIVFSLRDFPSEQTRGDASAQVIVRFRGELPALFREGQGIVALGTLEAPSWDGDGHGEQASEGGVATLEAQEVLAKHDEGYRPPQDLSD